MLLVNEEKLTYGCVELIGNCYGLKYDHNDWDEESYEEFTDEIVTTLWVDEEYIAQIIEDMINKSGDVAQGIREGLVKVFQECNFDLKN